MTRPSKIVCLGINYAAHGSEGGFKRPERPILFAKTPNTLNGPFDPIRLPRCSGKIDWEVELAVIVGREGTHIPRDRALDHVAGYTVMNDVSGREAQFADPRCSGSAASPSTPSPRSAPAWSPPTRSAIRGTSSWKRSWTGS